MSKSLINLLVQISKALVYSKNQILFRKEFSLTFGPIGPAASRPSRDPLVFLTGRSPSPHWASASRPARASVEPYPVAAFHTGERLQPRYLRPLFAPG
jgi:hypothetical protein